MKHLTLPIASVVVLVLAAVSIVRTQPTHQSNPPPSTPPRSPYPNRIAAVGLVEPSSEMISLGSHLPGVVDKVMVKAGDEVKAGQPLVKLDTRALESSLVERRSALTVSKAAVESATASVKRANAALNDHRNHLRFAEALSDARAISAEDLARRKSSVEIAEAELIQASAAVESAHASVAAAEAAVRTVETELDRSTVNAPIDATVLQIKIRRGEFIPAGASAHPWLMLGQIRPLHVRVEVDEHEAWRLQPGSKAVGQVRGNAAVGSPLTFVKLEPYVVPKQSLTGASTERVDTRVLQAIYRIERTDLPVFVGQQLDVFIESTTPLAQ